MTTLPESTPPMPLDESDLRHPRERLYFAAYVLLNLAVLAVAVVAILLGPQWLELHPVIAGFVKKLRPLLLLMLAAPLSVTFLRNTRLASVRGNGIRISPEQFPQIHALFEAQCTRLGLDTPPALYLSDEDVPGLALAMSIRNQDAIALSSDPLDTEPIESRDIIAFALGRELGRLRLGHTRWWDELLLTYVLRIPYVRNPLLQVRTYSHDRYGAYLAPNWLDGLLIHASSRRLRDAVNTAAFLRDMHAYRGFWARLAASTRKRPPLAFRIQALQEAGFVLPDQEMQDEALAAQATSHTEAS